MYFFFQKQIEYLGHTINPNGISPNSSKVQDILDFPAPNNVKQIKSFLDLARFYQPSMKGFASIANPLSKRLSKDAQFLWHLNNKRLIS